MEHDRIAVLDFGGQYAHLIATKVRRLCVRTDIVDPLAPLEELARYRGLILSGSPALSAYGEGADYTHGIYDLTIPILGLCYGHQEMAKHYGGTIEHTRREYGPARLRILAQNSIFAGIDADPIVWMSHGDSVTRLPEGFVELGSSDYGPHHHRNAAIASDALRRYGFQFHPEVDDTERGDEMLANFVLGICGCRPTWTIPNYVEEQIAGIQRRVGEQQVFLLASGGVDSTVCARLLLEALGPARVHLLHIDNGLMRKDESRRILERFEHWGLVRNLHFLDASADFLDALAGIIEPEAKRIAIGNTFIEVCQREMARLGVSQAVLAQGTIYPDTIETGGTRRADVIKTHHNRVPLVAAMVKAGKVLEPLHDLYKTEVRELGALLGLDRDLLERHPFPGPGLGVRLLCSRGADPRSYAELAAIEPVARELAAPFGLWSAVIPIRSVGVKADLRAYEWPVMLEGDVPWEQILEAAGRIYRGVDGVNRCCYALSPMNGPFRPLAAEVTRERLDLLREADHFAMEGLARHDMMGIVWQCPTVALPLEIDGHGRELIVLRPVLSARAMTARPARLPEALCRELREQILALPGVSGLCIDVTTKPPGTIEWE
ncbi:MAG: glutamine-hydrolyzing GMP synthase [Candidatus Eisenbacteria bacterium]